MQYYVKPGGRKQEIRSLLAVGREFDLEPELVKGTQEVYDSETDPKLGLVWYGHRPELIAEFTDGRRLIVPGEQGGMCYISGTKFEAMAGRAAVKKWYTTLMFQSVQGGSQLVRFIDQFPDCAKIGSRKRASLQGSDVA